jgi:hypothetical protein
MAMRQPATCQRFRPLLRGNLPIYQSLPHHQTDPEDGDEHAHKMLDRRRLIQNCAGRATGRVLVRR